MPEAVQVLPDVGPVFPDSIEVVQGLSLFCNRVTLKQAFNRFGEIDAFRKWKCCAQPMRKETLTLGCWIPPQDKRQTDCAFVRFSSNIAAQAALDSCNHGEVVLHGIPLRARLRPVKRGKGKGKGKGRFRSRSRDRRSRSYSPRYRRRSSRYSRSRSTSRRRDRGRDRERRRDSDSSRRSERDRDRDSKDRDSKERDSIAKSESAHRKMKNDEEQSRKERILLKAFDDKNILSHKYNQMSLGSGVKMAGTGGALAQHKILGGTAPQYANKYTTVDGTKPSEQDLQQSKRMLQFLDADFPKETAERMKLREQTLEELQALLLDWIVEVPHPCAQFWEKMAPEEVRQSLLDSVEEIKVHTLGMQPEVVHVQVMDREIFQMILGDVGDRGNGSFLAILADLCFWKLVVPASPRSKTSQSADDEAMETFVLKKSQTDDTAWGARGQRPGCIPPAEWKKIMAQLEEGIPPKRWECSHQLSTFKSWVARCHHCAWH
eukprot:gene126-217_t